VKILETDLDRKYFTKHGLQLNLSGKEQISPKLAAVIREFFNRSHLPSICMQWENPSLDGLNRRASKSERSKLLPEAKTLVSTDEMGKPSQLSKRQRKNPSFRNPDFLWI
jgi:hypothetical protein